jgi:hypothetical protein
VAVGVDETGHDDKAVGRDLLGVRADLCLDRDDAPVLDEDVAAGKVADVRVDGYDVTTTDERSMAHG